MHWIHLPLEWLGLLGLSIAAGYEITALLAVVRWRLQHVATGDTPLPGVTILKPLCGAEPGLYAHLRTFCLQSHPHLQILCGVSDSADPALSIVKKLQSEFPHLALEIVVDSRKHGSNRKVSNLINMAEHARYDVLVISDSDASAGPGYLAQVIAPLMDARVGLVTYIYRGVPTQPMYSRLGAMYINEWYMPSVLLAWLFGHEGFVSGQTMAIRRDTLQAIGGLEAIANHLADDNRLGELVRGLGQRVVLSTYLMQAQHHEPDLRVLVQHELRWMRTLKVLAPLSYCFLFVTFSLPLALLCLNFAVRGQSPATLAWLLFLITVMARLGLHFAHRLLDHRPLLADLWLLPLRDGLMCWVWFRAFFNSRVSWRGAEFEVAPDGVMRSLP